MKERLRGLLCEFGVAVRDRVLAARDRPDRAHVTGETEADVIYGIDRVAESTAVDWIERHWPAEESIQLVMEGLEAPRTIGAGAPKWTCIVDPIDGTRCLMTDKRSAWVLVGLAPFGGGLEDIAVCAMTELPPTRQGRSDQASAVRGCGVVAASCDLRSGEWLPLKLQPSQATDFRHGFASLAKFFPEGKARIAAVEEQLWHELYGDSRVPMVFDDQYVSTGGQIYEILAGRDRMVGDIRPYVLTHSLACHPYDICTGMLIQEAGAVLEVPTGGPISAPLDTTSAVAWVGYANPTLADLVRPILARLIRDLS